MKFVFFDDFKLGVLKGESVVGVSDVVSDIPSVSPQDTLSGLIADFDAYKSDLEKCVAESDGVPVSQVRLRSPAPRPLNIACMAVNYMENGTRSEPAPKNGFNKSPNSVIGDGDTILLPDLPATIFEHEAELALVIRKHAWQVKAEDAFDYIFGYMNFIDVSARGVPAFYQMKSRETFAPMGPWLVTADEIDDPQSLPVKLWVNGRLCQDFNTDDMAHKIPQVIEWVTSVHSLEPGDVIATGTNHFGLSAIQDGDSIEMEVAGLGRLNLSVRDDLKRTWGRETRHEWESAGNEGTTPQLTGKYA
ncbi:MAG: fumarylacetoacetate hydrolase family protein [Dehalococcoidia bacterium]|nr:fumarylacetoacetate hydrolase family protein [Dehalococcoidia bacterium]